MNRQAELLAWLPDLIEKPLPVKSQWRSVKYTITGAGTLQPNGVRLLTVQSEDNKQVIMYGLPDTLTYRSVGHQAWQVDLEPFLIRAEWRRLRSFASATLSTVLSSQLVSYILRAV